MSRQTFSGAGATAAVAVALLLGLLVGVVVSSSGSSPEQAAPAAGAASVGAEPTPSLRLAAQPVEQPGDLAVDQRSQDDAPEPATTTPVLPRRCLDGDDVLPSRAGACFVTAFKPSRPTVIIWGDSHAWQQVPALKEQAQRTGTNLVAFLMGACPPMDLRGQGYGGRCVKQSQRALDFIETQRTQQRPFKVVLGGFWELYRSYHSRAESGWSPTDPHEQFLVSRAAMFDVGGDRLFGTLARRDIPTAAIAQAPWVGDDAAACDAGEEPYACDLPRSTAIPAEATTARWLHGQLSRIRLSGYIDTSRFLCDPTVCHAELHGEPVYLDELHLDPAVTAAFSPEYRDLFS